MHEPAFGRSRPRSTGSRRRCPCHPTDAVLHDDRAVRDEFEVLCSVRLVRLDRAVSFADAVPVGDDRRPGEHRELAIDLLGGRGDTKLPVHEVEDGGTPAAPDVPPARATVSRPRIASTPRTGNTIWSWSMKSSMSEACASGSDWVADCAVIEHDTPGLKGQGDQSRLQVAPVCLGQVGILRGHHDHPAPELLVGVMLPKAALKSSVSPM